ncbi:MAG: hypothetical protein Q4C03_06315 [bacterium]|nr:hypothetical protein [bacterium]
MIQNTEKLIDCAKNQKGKDILLEIIGPIYTNFGINAGRGPIPAETTYRILPKEGGATENKKAGNGVNYHKGTPSPTDLNTNKPGRVHDPRIDRYRGGIRIHEMGLSEGCITIGSRYVTHDGKSIPLVSNKTGVGYIEQIMNSHEDCGGFYLEIISLDDYFMPEGLKETKASYTGTQYIPNIATSEYIML